MNPTVSKTQPAGRPFTQSLCRTAGLLLGLVAMASLALAKAPAAAAPPVPPDQALARAVTQWVGTQQGVDPASLRLAPLDPRLQVQACPGGLRMDFPFASRETVRVRCEAPAWQLFVRVLGSPPALARGPAAAPSNGAAPVSAEEKPAALRKVVVATGLLQRGTRLSADQLSLVDLPAPGLPPNVLDKIEDAVNAEVLRDVPGGTPLRSHDIRPAVMIKKGQLVMVSAGSPGGFKVMARLEALQDGRMGEQIKLRNKESGRQISAVVTGLNAADAL